MDITITPQLLNGNVDIIPSKSQAHRLLICAAFADLEGIISTFPFKSWGVMVISILQSCFNKRH